MSCCGGQRLGTSHPVPHPASAARRAPTVAFVYVGGSALTMVGGGTGRTYRFSHPGCRLDVDARDAPGAAGIASLRRAAS